MPEEEGWLDPVDVIMIDLNLPKTSAEVFLSVVDYPMVRNSEDPDDIFPYNNDFLNFALATSSNKLSKSEVEMVIEEFDRRGWLRVDPDGWAMWKGRTPEGESISFQGPTKFLGTWQHFHKHPRTYHFEKAPEQEPIAKDEKGPEDEVTKAVDFLTERFGGRVGGAYFEDGINLPPKARFSFSRSVEILVRPKFPLDPDDWREFWKKGV